MSNSTKPRLRLSRRPKDFKENPSHPILPIPERTLGYYADILLATLPLYLFGIYHYGFRPIILALISAVMMLGLDSAVKTVLKKDTYFDISPAVNGVIIALFFPASAPLWLPIVTSIIAVIFKTAFEYLPKISVSQNALTVLASFLLFPGVMNVIPERGQMLSPFALSPSGFKALQATPLETVMSGHLPETTPFEVFFGLNSARIGELSGILLIAVLVYMLARKAAKPILPLAFILTVGVFSYLSPSLEAASDFVALDGAIYNVFGSNTFLCAVFLLSPPMRGAKTPIGNAICGIISGIIAMLLRSILPIDITALIAVISVGIIAPIINIFIKPTPFGGYILPQKEESKDE